MPNLTPDMVRTLSFQRERGLSRRATRELIFTNVTGSDWPTMVDDVHTAIESSAYRMNAWFSFRYNQLRVVDQRFEIIRGEKTKVRAEIEYAHAYVRPEWEGGANIETVTDHRDGNGDPIVLQYTFPDDYEFDETLQGRQVNIPGEVSDTKIKPYIETWLTVPTNDPDTWLLDWSGYTNSDTFKGKSPRTWRLEVPTFEKFNVWTDPELYNFRIRIIHDPDGVDKTVIFEDPNTKRPPPDWQDKGAFQKIEKMPEKAFQTLDSGFMGFN